MFTRMRTWMRSYRWHGRVVWRAQRISNPDYANLLAKSGVGTVVSRQVFGGSDGLPDIRGEEAHDREIARQWYNDMRTYVLRCDPGVYVQLVNEQNLITDSFFYDELMTLAEGDSRKLCIHNDGGGCPGDTPAGRALYYDASGHAHSDVWHLRALSLQHAARGGHLYGWHSYGNITDGQYHRSDEEGAWPWFSGRGFELLSLADSVPDFIITEFGSGATQFTQQLGFDEMWSNYCGFEAKALAKYPALMAKCRGVNQWTFGEVGFPGQDVQQWVGQMIERQRL